MKWSVGSKLAAGFFSVILVLVVLAMVTAYANSKLGNRVEVLYQRGIIGTEALGRAAALLHQSRGRTFLHVATTDPNEKRQAEDAVSEFQGQFLEELDRAQQLMPAADPRRARIDGIRERFLGFSRIRDDRVYAASNAGDTQRALEVMVTQYGPQFMETSEALRSVIADNVSVNQGVFEDTEATLTEASLVTLFGSLLATLVAAIAAWMTSRSISTRLRELAGAARRVSQGDLRERADVVGGDEIADVGRALNEMTAALSTKIEGEQAAAEQQAEERQKLAKAVEGYARFVDRVARGELTADVLPAGEGDIAELGHNLDAMGKALRTMTLRIHEAVGGLSSASAEILTTAQEHGASANESASAVAQTVAAVDQVQQSASAVAEAARQVAAASRQSVEVSSAGKEAVDNTVRTMSDVRHEVDAIAARILALSEQVQAVGQIINSVNELAEQSNLLALNASIEAARAGEEGRGFAVVAQEIRGLADQSRQATAEVRSILGDIQKSTSEAVLATEQGSSAVGRAAEAAQATGSRIDQLATTISEAAESAQHIESSSEQQVQGVAQISQAMHSISEASRQTVDGTRNVESAARGLNELSGRLRDAVAQYRT